MKKWISTILSISLVIGMAAMLHACGQPKPEAESTTEQTQMQTQTPEEVTALSTESDEETTGDSSWADMWGLEDLSVPEHSTNEHYQEEYDALTLPMAVTTQPVAGTTRAQTTTNPSVRETTTEFKFTSPSRAATTKKETAGTTAAAEKATTAASTTASATTAPAAETETTSIPDYVPNAGGVQAVTSTPRPQVTLLDKYVGDILKSGKFTLQMEMKEDGKTVPISLYEDDNNMAIEMTITNLVMQDLQLPASVASIGKVRFLVTGKQSAHPKAYILWPGGYMEMENAEDVSDMIREMQSEQDMNVLTQLMEDGLEYCGKSSGIGYVCETYKNTEENMQYNFYFTKTSDGYEGIVRWDRVDLSTGKTETQIVMRLSRGITNSKAFKVEGKKTSMEDFEKLFS